MTITDDRALGQPPCGSDGTTVICSSRLPAEISPAQGSRYALRQVVCEDRYDYWRGLATLWGEGSTIINVEHDMQFSDALVADLLDCPHPRCCHAYICWLPEMVWAHTYDGCGMHGTWIREDEEWAGYSAIGFCKLTPEARTLPLGRATWQGLERSVNDASPGPWHIHWPGVSHYHELKVVETRG